MGNRTPVKTLLSTNRSALYAARMHWLLPAQEYRLFTTCTWPKRTRGMRSNTPSAHQQYWNVTLIFPSSAVAVSELPNRSQNMWFEEAEV
jgi:hypothetical protein